MGACSHTNNTACRCASSLCLGPGRTDSASAGGVRAASSLALIGNAIGTVNSSAYRLQEHKQPFLSAACSPRSFADVAAKPLPFLSTDSQIDGRRTVRQLGVVTASSVRTKNILYDVLEAVRRVVGGECVLYTQLLNETTAEATKRLLEVAQDKGATSVIRVKYETTTTMNRLLVGLHVCVLAYGTAVIDEAVDQRHR